MADPGSTPGAVMANQAVHPSGVGKLVAVGRWWLSTSPVIAAVKVRHDIPRVETRVGGSVKAV